MPERSVFLNIKELLESSRNQPPVKALDLVDENAVIEDGDFRDLTDLPDLDAEIAAILKQNPQT
jgi:hypothetical protein